MNSIAILSSAKLINKNLIYSYIVNFLLLAFLLTATSCFKVGLPERFYSYEIKDQKHQFVNYPYAFISIPSRLETYGLDESKSDHILGHQYVLGAIPFTSLYLEHGLNSLFLESLVQHLHSEGIVPIIVSKKLSDAYGLNSLTFNGQLSATVYDLIFTRMIHFSGQVIIDHQKIDIDFSDYYSQAQYPLVARLLQLEILEKLEKQKIVDTLNYKTQKKISGNKGLIPVVLGFPAVDIVEAKVLKEFSKTYGDASTMFSNNMLARLLQRGIEAGLENKNYQIETIALAASYSNVNTFEGLSKLKISLIDLQISDNLQVRILFDDLISKVVCSATVEIDKSRDGALNLAMEKAGENAVNALLRKDKRYCETTNR